MMGAKKPLALYLHIPFCAAKCAYCDFASYPNREDVWAEYSDALTEEWRSWRGMLTEHEIRTMFIGGGTPSLIPAERIAHLLETVFSGAQVASDAEITIEANPGTLTPDKLQTYRRAGVNRISLGAQAMDDGLLRALGRIHSVEDVRSAVGMARNAGFDNLSLDLMYGLPGQTIADWRETLRRAVELQPEHLSAYSLILEEGTPLARRAEREDLRIPDDDATMDMQRIAVDVLSEAGYGRYEISNYSKPGRECRHNIVYWERGEYLGLGCAAHSLMDGERFENPRELEAYLSGRRREDRVRLSREDRIEETLMLSTRMCRGLDLAAFRSEFGVRLEECCAGTIEKLAGFGLAEIRDGFLRLTVKGLELQNAVVVELLEALAL